MSGVSEAAFAEPDFFASRALVADPYPYYEELRGRCPVTREPHHGVVMVTGYDEAAAVLSDASTFSSCNAMTGPFPGFPVPLAGDDVSDLIEAHRAELPMSEEITTMDPPRHAAFRAIVARHLTPRKIAAVEPAMNRLADELIDGLAERGTCELIGDFSGRYSLLNTCELLGVPAADHPMFIEEMLDPRRGLLAGVGDSDGMAVDPFAFLHARFATYIEDRQQTPRNDVMTSLATTPFPDGSMPTTIDMVRLASILFIAGIGTTAGLIATAIKNLAETPGLQDELRANPDLIPDFIEEVLRFEGEMKGTFRLARTTTDLGGTRVEAGSDIMLVVAAANRDPRKFDAPDEFRLGRPNKRGHLGFGHGAHVCVGAPFARVETRIALERLLARLDNISISEATHGPAEARVFKYVPTYLTRSLRRLSIDFVARETS
jgi:cytochrome P450 family 150 subfamily A5